jgi:hypothetical protein
VCEACVGGGRGIIDTWLEVGRMAMLLSWGAGLQSGRQVLGMAGAVVGSRERVALQRQRQSGGPAL